MQGKEINIHTISQDNPFAPVQPLTKQFLLQNSGIILSTLEVNGRFEDDSDLSFLNLCLLTMWLPIALIFPYVTPWLSVSVYPEFLFEMASVPCRDIPTLSP